MQSRKNVPFRKNILSLTALSGVVLLSVAACSTPGSSAAGTESAKTGEITVVASTSAYGSLVKAIGGDKVTVESIVSKISQDPHSYEATAQDRLKVSKAGLVVVNGGGYDSFMDGMVADAKLDPANVINAVNISGLQQESTESPAPSTSAADDHGHDHDHGSFNEHVWYNFPAMQKVAAQVEQRLSALAPASAAEFKHNAEAFTSRLSGYQQTLEKLTKGSHVDVAVTEPVPLYLLEAAGLHNVTPEEFTSAVEEGHDVPASVLDETLKLFSSKKAAFLAYNEQTSGPQTEAVKKAATDAGAPVVSFTETLPDGKDYLSWMSDNVDAVQKAVEKVRG
ncbi:zinc ABC transporter substrate-binding protein [Arthrobacter sp. Y-9]|uniref:metal ABC transporter solute-binding protein, Zn/Mn family n=1 Tax=Arthrobacter sp. Y-9 TaxID=3039385 RepID=UPI00241DF78A|nr:zinc ABC transporter substrate-binding protein [Arthrobacter sp. Y-9]WFR83051.1 zinc ABC transporter substrate-binding protein [Arthrobacter sp. Y-9]